MMGNVRYPCSPILILSAQPPHWRKHTTISVNTPGSAKVAAAAAVFSDGKIGPLRWMKMAPELPFCCSTSRVLRAGAVSGPEYTALLHYKYVTQCWGPRSTAGGNTWHWLRRGILTSIQLCPHCLSSTLCTNVGSDPDIVLMCKSIRSTYVFHHGESFYVCNINPPKSQKVWPYFCCWGYRPHQYLKWKLIHCPNKI